MKDIGWLDWGQEAFALAGKERKPILLDISAVWCHWCHVMDETTYSDPEVVERINRDFIPVRVDNDRRPDVNSRYNMGGWPTTAFLTPEGEILTGATYVPPEDMRRILGKVHSFYRKHEREITERVGQAHLEGTAGEPEAELQPARGGRPGAAGTPGADERLLAPDEVLEAVSEVLERAEEGYDPLHGGFGVAPKFPQVGLLNLLLIHHLRTGDGRHLEMLSKTLRAMKRGGMYDQVAGGFFRYSTTRDWEVPHFEKMLEDNSELLAIYSRTARLTGEKFLLDAALDVARFMTAWLRSDQGFFFGSQDADEDYYKLSGEERKGREAPFVDRTLYVGWNALATRGFLEAYLATGEVRLRETALVALEYVWASARLDDGLLAHYCDEEGAHGPVLLHDATELALAFLDAYEVTGETGFLTRASQLLHKIREAFGDPRGLGFYDTLAEGEKPGRLRFRQKGLTDNARTALALLRLADIVMDPQPRRAAEGALAHFLGPHRRHGILAADYALALDWAAGPTVEVTVSGRRDDAEAEALLREAAAAVSGARAVRWSFSDEELEEALAETGAGEGTATGGKGDRGVVAGDRADRAAAYLCVDGRCLAPIHHPAEVSEAIREAARRGRAAAPGEPAHGRDELRPEDTIRPS